MLKPHENDPNYEEEMERFRRDPTSWGTPHTERDILKGTTAGVKSLEEIAKEKTALAEEKKRLDDERAQLELDREELEKKKAKSKA